MKSARKCKPKRQRAPASDRRFRLSQSGSPHSASVESLAPPSSRLSPKTVLRSPISSGAKLSAVSTANSLARKKAPHPPWPFSWKRHAASLSLEPSLESVVIPTTITSWNAPKKPAPTSSSPEIMTCLLSDRSPPSASSAPASILTDTDRDGLQAPQNGSGMLCRVLVSAIPVPWKCIHQFTAVRVIPRSCAVRKLSGDCLIRQQFGLR